MCGTREHSCCAALQKCEAIEHVAQRPKLLYDVESATFNVFRTCRTALMSTMDATLTGGEIIIRSHLDDTSRLIHAQRQRYFRIGPHPRGPNLVEFAAFLAVACMLVGRWVCKQSWQWYVTVRVVVLGSI